MINHHELLICERMLDSITLLTRAAAIFRERCVRALVGNEERSWQNLLASSALATILVPRLGYAIVSDLVRGALAEDRPFVQAAVEQGHVQQEGIRQELRRAALHATAADS